MSRQLAPALYHQARQDCGFCAAGLQLLQPRSCGIFDLGWQSPRVNPPPLGTAATEHLGRSLRAEPATYFCGVAVLCVQCASTVLAGGLAEMYVAGAVTAAPSPARPQGSWQQNPPKKVGPQGFSAENPWGSPRVQLKIEPWGKTSALSPLGDSPQGFLALSPWGSPRVQIGI